MLLQEYLLVIYCLPLVAFHLVQYKTRSYKHYFLTRQEYEPTAKRVVKGLKIKLAYYSLFLLLVGFEFLHAATNLVLYNLLGYTI